MESIRYHATIHKVQTLVDGGYRVAMDIVPPTDMSAIVAMMQAANKPGVVMICAAAFADEAKRKEWPPDVDDLVDAPGVDDV